MATYLVQTAFTTSALAALVANPQDRTDTIRKPVEKLGGKLIGIWFAFGDYDVVGIIEMPDNVTAAAFVLAIAAGGSVKTQKTTPLFSFDEGVAAMKKAASSGYLPVSAK